MHIIDQYAYSNRLRHIDPAHKTGLALAVLFLCLALNEPPVGLVAAGWMYLLAVRVAGLPARVFGRVLAAQLTFLILATVGVVISLTFTNPGSVAPWAWRVGPVWISATPDSLYQGGLLVSRALGAASAMNFLALTTPLIDLVELFRRWRLPVILIDLMTIIYRFIFVLLESLTRMSMAQESRLGYNTSYFRAMNNAALLGSRLFIDAFHRSQRLQTALESRGYDGGDLQVLPAHYRSQRNLWWISAAVTLSLIGVWLIG